MTPETEEREKVEAKSLGEKLHEACCPVVSVWSRLPNDTRAVYEANALRFAASLTHDETASAVIASMAEEIERLKGDAEESAGFLHEMREQLTAEQDRATSAEAQVESLNAELHRVRGQSRILRELNEIVDRALTPNQGDDHDPA